MKSLQTQTTSVTGLISIIIIYIFLIALILVFSNQILQDVAMGRPMANLIFIPLAVGLPVFLIGTILFNIFRLVRDTRRGAPGTRFKVRLILFFAFIALLSSIPQGILSISFINTTTESWFSPKYGEALRGGIHIALAYYDDRLETLENLQASTSLSSLLREAEKQPERSFQEIKAMNSTIDFLQIFNSRGEELTFQGEIDGRISNFKDITVTEGLLPKETKQEKTIFRAVSQYTAKGETYSAVLGTILPEGFDKEAQNLTNTLEIFSQLEEFQRVFRIVLILFYASFSFPILLLAILISFMLSDEIIRPIINLEDATRKVSEGDYSIRILTRTKDELSNLIRSFNHMVAELERSRRQLIQTEKVTTWQEIAQRMAHEIKNPLTPIKLSAQRILKRYESGKTNLGDVLVPSATSIIGEVERLNNLLTEFRDFARLPEPKMEVCSISELVLSAASVFRFSSQNVLIHTENIDPGLFILADSDQINQVFTNLITNGLEAINGKGEISIRADLVTKGNLDYCRIQIQDTGSGIQKENSNKVFNPYFTTKEKGTGLGLSIVERIILDHNGQIWFESQPGIGTTFFIDLPKADRD